VGVGESSLVKVRGEQNKLKPNRKQKKLTETKNRKMRFGFGFRSKIEP
jgi:hypothetical protein